ncbi:hypothetical protein ATN84_18485 [Paramesorhizobium deserti]|uniref:Uncharacterized protein n=1 Tax=Paramesorhizobium deserti TaxID=1494590 RepID=A0A135HQ64_9HYPH|nr:hypothetical protein [Paramesorhizobium deserti]KXF75263.1 hypothetical protein ATN84_18485 [Paramesorhizobium deserti]
MPHFDLEVGEDGTVTQVRKDGDPYKAAVQLEQVYTVVSTYFRLASDHLRAMSEQESANELRGSGLQSFVMSLTGLEAFANTYFHVRGNQLGSAAILQRLEQRSGTLSRKFADLIAMTPEQFVTDQATLIDRIFQFSNLRNTIMHPRWTPSSMSLPGIHIDGLVENPQAIFEDANFCREAHYWCLLLIARIGEAQGISRIDGFLFHWTGYYGMTLATILNELGFSPETIA